MPSALSQIRTQINTHLQKSANERMFIDHNDLVPILTYNVILDAMLECSIPAHLQARFANKIFKKGRTTFAILIHIRKPDSIVAFLERNELDRRLPFNQQQVLDILPEDGTSFFKNQWEFVPFIFQRDYHQHIPDGYVLPFLTDTRLEELEGGFGAISEVTIASSMQKLVANDKGLVTFIRKRIKTGNTEETRKNYNQERECLELLRLRRHDHILELLASYTYKNDYNFLFPRIDMDLEMFLMLDEKYGAFKQNITYITALEGLSSALESIHELHLNKSDHEVDISRIGYHHDLRPRNILVTPNKFLLADFGLSKFKAADAGSRTKWKESIGDYIAPECMNQDFEPQDVGRAIDIWALGGIILDLAWHREQGAKGVEQTRLARRGPADKNNRITQCFFLEDKIKVKVIDSSDELRSHAKDSTTAGLLRLAFSMLQIAPEKRPLALDVHRHTMFLTVKSFFEFVRKVIRDYIELLLKQPDQSPLPIKFRFEVTRLDAWASVLGLDNQGMDPETFSDAMQSIENNVRYTEGVLKEIENAFRCRENERSNFMTAELDIPPISIEYDEQRYELLHQLIEKLLKILPLTYSRRIDQVCQQLYVGADETQAFRDRSLTLMNVNDSKHEDILAISSMKALRLEFYDQFRRDGDVGLLLPERGLSFDEDFNSPSKPRIGWYHRDEGTENDSQIVPVQVLVERIYCPPTIKIESSEERVARIGALAELLHQKPKPKDFRVLDCLGFVDSSLNQGFEFVYHFPHAVDGEPRLIPKTLKELLKAGVPEPALEERIGFAKALVASIHQLHAVDWLHRNISPVNILFFVLDTKKPHIKWEEPYLVNFSHSRPDGNVWFTDGPTPEQDYQHPEYLNEESSNSRIKKQYDYYSIGIVLLEVGLWRPLIDTLKHKGGSPVELRNTLIQQYLPALRRTVGKNYRNATRECLEGTHLQEPVESHWVSGFFEHVMEPLSEVRF